MDYKAIGLASAQLRARGVVSEHKHRALIFVIEALVKGRIARFRTIRTRHEHLHYSSLYSAIDEDDDEPDGRIAADIRGNSRTKRL